MKTHDFNLNSGRQAKIELTLGNIYEIVIWRDLHKNEDNTIRKMRRITVENNMELKIRGNQKLFKYMISNWKVVTFWGVAPPPPSVSKIWSRISLWFFEILWHLSNENTFLDDGDSVFCKFVCLPTIFGPVYPNLSFPELLLKLGSQF